TRSKRDWSSDVCSSDLRSLFLCELLQGLFHLLIGNVRFLRFLLWRIVFFLCFLHSVPLCRLGFFLRLALCFFLRRRQCAILHQEIGRASCSASAWIEVR